MREHTHIVQNNTILIKKKGELSILKAIYIARKKDIQGKIEIHHILEHKKENYTYATYLVNTQNKTQAGFFY